MLLEEYATYTPTHTHAHRYFDPDHDALLKEYATCIPPPPPPPPPHHTHIRTHARRVF